MEVKKTIMTQHKNNNRLERIERCVLKTTVLFVVIFQKKKIIIHLHNLVVRIPGT